MSVKNQIEKNRNDSLERDQTRHWSMAVATSILLGFLFVLFAGGKPPIPLPGEAATLFWLGWGPATALGLLIFGAIVDSSKRNVYSYTAPAVAIVLITVYAAVIVWNRTDDVAILVALHLPLIAWAAVGISLGVRNFDPAIQGYAFLVKSVETVMTGGIYFGAGGIFLGLTVGIFKALGVTIPQSALMSAMAWIIGVIPVLALATVYDPKKAPASQDWNTGVARILRIVSWLILPLALGVMAVYTLWFIPAYFWRPFEQREVLIVYNATILAVLVSLTLGVMGPQEQRSRRLDAVLRYGALALGILTFALNSYALAAIVSRIHRFGLTPNRYAVLGWNVVTLAILAAVIVPLWRNPSNQWSVSFRAILARFSVLAVVWALWIIVGLPLSFD